MKLRSGRFITLALILALTLSLTSGALAVDFIDRDAIKYTEAVDIMTGLGMIDGIPGGAGLSFEPSGTLTREQACKIICCLKSGGSGVTLGNTVVSSFSDVDPSRWSSPYIEYCASLGIVKGSGDGTFSPGKNLTTAEYVKMLLVTLGYDPEAEGFTGNSWAINVAKVASTAGLIKTEIPISGEREITREEGCMLAFLFLRCSTVKYEYQNSNNKVLVIEDTCAAVKFFKYLGDFSGSFTSDGKGGCTATGTLTLHINGKAAKTIPGVSFAIPAADLPSHCITGATLNCSLFGVIGSDGKITLSRAPLQSFESIAGAKADSSKPVIKSGSAYSVISYMGTQSVNGELIYLYDLLTGEVHFDKDNPAKSKASPAELLSAYTQPVDGSTLPWIGSDYSTPVFAIVSAYNGFLSGVMGIGSEKLLGADSWNQGTILKYENSLISATSQSSSPVTAYNAVNDACFVFSVDVSVDAGVLHPAYTWKNNISAASFANSGVEGRTGLAVAGSSGKIEAVVIYNAA